MQAAFVTQTTDDDCNKSSSFLMSSQPCKHIRTVGPSPCPELYTRLLEPQEQSCSGSQPTVESLEMSELTSLHRREPEKGNNSVSNRREVSCHQDHSQCEGHTRMTITRKREAVQMRLSIGHTRLNDQMCRKPKLVPSPTCPCGQEDQTTEHVLQRCHMACGRRTLSVQQNSKAAD